jgi:predicted transposase/invertase (TIGR01784 family)
MLMTEWNWDDALEVAREDGLEEGIERGREEGLVTGIEFAARNALAKGIPVQTVQEITGLDLNAIEAIKAKLPNQEQ